MSVLRVEQDSITIGEDIIEKNGKIGIFAIMISISVPVSLLFIGIKRKN